MIKVIEDSNYKILVDGEDVADIRITEDHPNIYTLRYTYKGKPKYTSRTGGCFDLWSRSIHFEDDDFLIVADALPTHRISIERIEKHD